MANEIVLLNPSVNVDENGRPLPRDQQRALAFFLHDAEIANGEFHRVHARGSVAQVRGDRFDALVASGHVVAAEGAPTVLPSPWPTDRLSPTQRRAEEQRAKVAARVVLKDQQRVDESNRDRELRAGLAQVAAKAAERQELGDVERAEIEIANSIEKTTTTKAKKKG